MSCRCLRDHTVVVWELAFDELGEEVNIAEHEAGLRLANFNQNFGVGIRQQLHELLNGLARKDGFDAAVKLDFRIVIAAGQTVTVGGNSAHFLFWTTSNMPLR